MYSRFRAAFLPCRSLAILALFGLHVSGCGSDAASNASDVSVTKQFFKNATRRDATTEEAALTAKITNIGCTAFFVESTSDKTLMASARHCFNFDAPNWCSTDGAITTNDGA